jgi:hypothetical protein
MDSAESKEENKDIPLELAQFQALEYFKDLGPVETP